MSTTKRTLLVTGATDGIGKVTAKALVDKGHDVVVHGRSADKVEAVVKSIAGSNGKARGVVFDLADLDAVAAGAADVGAVDVVVCNAGVFEKAPKLTKQHHETTVAVNHLAHFSLVLRLLPTVMKHPQGRIVVVSSMAHARGRVDFDALEHNALQKGWDSYGAYGESKLMNVLFSNELARRLQRAGSTTTSNSLHPGVVSTKLLTQGFGMSGPDSHDDGAATSVFLAVDPSVATTSGAYFTRSRPAQPSLSAQDVDVAARLWAVSAKLTGVDFSPATP